jgi:hypothetical protein
MVSDVFYEISHTHILVLEEFCCSEEQVCSFVCLELFATAEKKYDTREERATFPWVDRRFVENAGVLENRNLAVRIHFVVLFARHLANRREEERRKDLAHSLVSKVGPRHHDHQQQGRARVLKRHQMSRQPPIVTARNGIQQQIPDNLIHNPPQQQPQDLHMQGEHQQQDEGYGI